MHQVLCITVMILGLALIGKAHAHGVKKHAQPAVAINEQQPWGIAGNVKRVNRTVVIRMTDDMRFHPEHIRVRQGETIRFVIRNEGRLLHEIVIGTKAMLDEHAEMMRRFPGMEHDEPWMAHVEPGGSGEIIWYFNRAGEFAYACLIPGHYEAGMRGNLRVVSK